MVSTLNLQADVCHLIHIVSKVLFLSYYAESKRISLITIFFVTTFFVVTAKIALFAYIGKFSQIIIRLSLPSRRGRDCDSRRRFAWCHLWQVGKGNDLNFAMDVDTVEDYIIPYLSKV
jgi:hypothetical protein